MSQVFENFINFYRNFSQRQLVELTEIYHPEVIFEDPVNRLQGLGALEEYFAHSMQGLDHCEFDFLRKINNGQQAYVEWVMSYRHRRLKNGRLLKLSGTTVIEIQDKVCFHRDYYDMGEMLYEHLPILGNVVKGLKRKIAV